MFWCVSATRPKRPLEALVFTDRQLLLAGSSLQLILAAALAEEARQTADRPSWLVFMPEVLDPEFFQRALERIHGSPFERIVTVAPRHRGNQAGNPRSWRELRAELLQILDDAHPTSLTVFNDRQEAAQVLLIESARRHPRALRECAEDGSLAYTGFAYRPHSWFTCWVRRLRFGPTWHDVTALGTHPLVQDFVAVHPELVRAELRSQPLRQFPSDLLSAPALRRMASAFCAEADFDSAAVAPDALLLTLSHSSYAHRNPDYVRLMKACVAQARTRDQPLLYKYHPRESEQDYLDLRAAGARELPRILPVECIFLLARGNPITVLAGMSSALLTARLLMPLARIAALMHASNSGDTWDPSLMRALRITALDDERTLAAFLDGPADAAVRSA